MMDRSLPESKVIDHFDRYDRTLSLLSFECGASLWDSHGQRKTLATRLNLLDALALMTRENLEFRTVRILVHPPQGLEEIRTLEALNLSRFAEYVWMPERGEFRVKGKG